MTTLRSWHPSQGPCPPILGITLQRPWSWAFFEGGPGLWKDVENRTRLPEVPAGTWLAIHNGSHWSKDSERIIRQRLPGLSERQHRDCPAGVIVGLVQVRRISRDRNTGGSRWRLPWDVGIWLDDRRLQFQQPIVCGPGWFDVWTIPEYALREIQQHAGDFWPRAPASSADWRCADEEERATGSVAGSSQARTLPVWGEALR